MNLITKKLNLHPAERVLEFGFNELSGLRFSFINMPLRESAQPNTPPQGPALMAARLRMYGAEVDILDLNAYRIRESGEDDGRHLTMDEARALIERHYQHNGEPHIIGLSGMITTLRWQTEITRQCRGMAPDALIVSGGGLATELREGLFGWMRELDAIVHSEGDDIVLVLAKAVKDGLRKAHGVAVRSLDESEFSAGRVDGRERYFFHGDRPRALDDLPFAAWDLLEEDADGNHILEQYISVPVWGLAANNSSATPFTMTRSLTTVSSRGCPYACAFCYRGAQGERNYGMRSAENVAKEVRWLVDRYGVDFVGFPDDNFAVDKRRIAQLPDALAGTNIQWGTHTRLDEADERLEDMAKSGCVYIGFGAESASPNTLEHMRKGGHILRRGTQRINGYDMPTTMLDGIGKCREVGIHANCTWIMGFPGETLVDLKISVAFIMWQRELYTRGFTTGTVDYENQLASVNSRMFTATAYPGTEMFKLPSVRAKLSENFNIKFDKAAQPIYDNAFRNYVLELDDATKLLVGSDGRPLNFGAMPETQFVEARKLADQDCIEKILDL